MTNRTDELPELETPLGSHALERQRFVESLAGHQPMASIETLVRTDPRRMSNTGLPVELAVQVWWRERGITECILVEELLALRRARAKFWGRPAFEFERELDKLAAAEGDE